MLKQIEGSHAVAEVVAKCRPNVISAYPITPQTHIVEELASIVGRGDLDAEYVNVESEFSAASVVLGASAAGARAYSATTSQGLLLMSEVVYCIAGMRLTHKQQTLGRRCRIGTGTGSTGTQYNRCC